MRKAAVVRLVVAIFLCTSLAVSVGHAGSLEPAGPPVAGTMKRLDEVEPRIAIDTLPGSETAFHVISQPGSYYLTANITANHKHAIEIAASNVTLDLMGFEIRSSWIYSPVEQQNQNFDGISITAGKKDIEIKNGTIFSNRSSSKFGTYSGFRHGIRGDSTLVGTETVNAERITVANLRIAGSRACGVSLDKSSGCRVVGCTVSGCDQYGIHLGDGGVVQDCTSAQNYSGIYLTMAGGSAKGNYCYGNELYGIYIYCGFAEQNVCSLNNTGISATASTLINNVVRASQRKGFTAEASVLTGNQAVSNGEHGIWAYAGSRVEGNTCYLNQMAGIYAYNGSLVRSNTCCRNGREGIKAEDSLVENNAATDNDQLKLGLKNLSVSSDCTVGTNHAP